MRHGKLMWIVLATVALAACGDNKTSSNTPSTPGGGATSDTGTSGSSASESNGSDSTTNNPVSQPSLAIAGRNYYDVNMNGSLDVNDATAPSPWPLQVTPLNQDGTPAGDPIVICTDASGAYAYDWPSLPSYPRFTVAEVQATNSTVLSDGTTFPTWVQTTSTSNVTVDPASGASVTLANSVYDITGYDTTTGFNITGLNFGNLCIGYGGAPGSSGSGGALGFWAHDTDPSIQPSDVMSALSSALSSDNPPITLCNGSGSYQLTTYSDFSNWLTGNATNMAYKLSTQLASMWLNVHFNFVSGAAFLYAPNSKSADQWGIATVQDLMAEANAELVATSCSAPAGSADRAYQQALKNDFDGGNNNKGFIQTDLAQCPTPTFAQSCP